MTSAVKLVTWTAELESTDPTLFPAASWAAIGVSESGCLHW